MKAPDKLLAIARRALGFGRRWTPPEGDPVPATDAAGPTAVEYPTGVLDIIIFHKLHLSLHADRALKSYRVLKERFVDWNEVRISSVREIQEALSLCPGSLELAVFIKDVLELIHRERQDVSLEFLAEMNLGEIRQYLKQIRGIDRSTVEMILRIRKGHPVFPLSSAMETVLVRLGVLRPSATRTQSEKALYEQMDPARGLVFHHFLLDHSHALCPPDENAINCPRCSLRPMCAFYARTGGKNRRSVPRARRRGSARKSARRAQHSTRRRSGARPSRLAKVAKGSPLRGNIKRRIKGILKSAGPGKRGRKVAR